jgi:CTD small phosphatase-like protein 2
VFTASFDYYANAIIDKFDPDRKLIPYLLCRQHCLPISETYFLKDLRNLVDSRHLEDIIIVDNSPFAYSLQMENGIPILPFYDDKNDNELKVLKDFLIPLANVPDVRPYLKAAFMHEVFEMSQTSECVLTHLSKSGILKHSPAQRDGICVM